MYVRSEGCDDPGNVVKCGRAYIYVHGVDHSLHRRGHNIVVVDAKTGNAFFFGLLVNMSGFLIKKRVMFMRITRSGLGKIQISKEGLLRPTNL